MSCEATRKLGVLIADVPPGPPPSYRSNEGSTDKVEVSTSGGTAQDTAVGATTSRLCLLRFLEIEEAGRCLKR